MRWVKWIKQRYMKEKNKSYLIAAQVMKNMSKRMNVQRNVPKNEGENKYDFTI